MRKLSKEVWGWALYDWANSAFAVSILAIVYQLYFKTRLATSGIGESGELVETVTLPFGWTVGSEALWPFVVAVSMVIVVLITPVVGAVADYAGKKRGFLLFFCALGASATILMALLTVGMWKLGILLFVVGNAGSQFPHRGHLTGFNHLFTHHLFFIICFGHPPDDPF